MPGIEMLSVPAVQKTRLVDTVADQLRDLILEGTISPGTRLVQEQLAEKLGVSRTPLREAFRILERENLVRVLPKNNTVEVIQLTGKDALELYQVREMVDGLAARLAAGGSTDRATRPHLERLTRVVQRIEAAPFEIRNFINAHTEFHLRIAQLCGNAHLLQFSSVIRISTQMLYPRMRTGSERITQSVNEHAKILDAVLQGRAADAETLARAHIRAAMDFWFSGA